MLKVVPEFTPELVRKCERRLIVASATMEFDSTGPEGRLGLPCWLGL
jgi:hypothetical protein